MSTTTGVNNRDLFLDVLKGLGCLLMIMAHMPFREGNYKYFTFVGGFAPILFFVVAGVTASFQAQRHPVRSTLLNYLCLFLLGFALNGFHSPDFLLSPVIHFDMISTIALCSVIVYLLEFYARPRLWVWLLLGFLSFVIKWLLAIILPVESHPSLAGVLLPHVGTFPLIPWLFLFLFGVAAYRTGILFNFSLAVLALGTYLVLDTSGFLLDYRNKFDMSVGYFLLACLILFTSFSVIRKFVSVFPPSSKNFLVFLGRNSLLFLFLHFGVIRVLSGRFQLEKQVQLFKQNPAFFWLFILMVTLVVMVFLVYLAQRMPFEKLFHRVWIWIVLIALVLITPLLLRHDGLIRWLEIGFGILGGLYYPHLRHALQGDKRGQYVPPVAGT